MSSHTIWTPKFLAMLGKVTDTIIATKMGINKTSVLGKRVKLGIPRFPRKTRWTPENTARLGTMQDQDLAALLGLKTTTVTQRRNSLGIKCFDPYHFEWTAQRMSDLRLLSVRNFAKRYGMKPTRVLNYRVKFKVIPLVKQRRINWTSELLADLRLLTLAEFAAKHHIDRATACRKRQKLGFKRPDSDACVRSSRQHAATMRAAELSERYPYE